MGPKETWGEEQILFRVSGVAIQGMLVWVDLVEEMFWRMRSSMILCVKFAAWTHQKFEDFTLTF